MMIGVVFGLLWCVSLTLCSDFLKPNYQAVLDLACIDGDLLKALKVCKTSGDSAEALHILASLELIINSNANKAVQLHNEANLIGKVIPPLAKLHLDGYTCGGFSDLFYVAAVITKELVDTNLDHSKLLSGLTTLITLTSDSGLHAAAERHMQHALALSNHTVEHSFYQFRSALMTPGVFDSNRHIQKTRDLLTSRIQNLRSSPDNLNALHLVSLDEFVLSPTFYFVYQGMNDRDLLTALHEAYAVAHPALVKVEIEEVLRKGNYYYQQQHQSTLNTKIGGESHIAPRKIRVGFVSSYFRRHSVCKLFCGILPRLDPAHFEVVAFSSLQETREDAHTTSLKQHTDVEFVALGKTLVRNRQEVLRRGIDVLVYLDVGMEPSTVVWAAARLAPVQICLWGHPSTTGLASMDYYISSAGYHNAHHYNVISNISDSVGVIDSPVDSVVLRRNSTAQDAFLEQLVQLDSLGFYFERPVLDVVAAMSSGGEGSSKHNRHQYTRDLTLRTDNYYTAIMNELKTLNTSGSLAVLRLVQGRFNANEKIVLCAQHLPKLHPDFDSVLGELLLKLPTATVVLLDIKNKQQWRRTLTARFKKSFASIVNDSIRDTPVVEQIRRSELHGRKFTGDSPLLNNVTTVERMLARIAWLPSLTPREYLLLMAVGDVSLDPFPFGGGVTTLEALAVCTPVITLPSSQSVPSLAAGMLQAMEMDSYTESLLVADSAAQYVAHVVDLLSDDQGGEVFGDESDLAGEDYISEDDGGSYGTAEGEETPTAGDKKGDVFFTVNAAGEVEAVQRSVLEDDDSYVSTAALKDVPQSSEGRRSFTHNAGEARWETLLVQTRRAVCSRVDRLFSQEETVREWEGLLRNIVKGVL